MLLACVMQLVVEPSGAAPLAAVLCPRFQSDAAFKGLQRVGLILSGGNVDFKAKGFWEPAVWQPAGVEGPAQ